MLNRAKSRGFAKPVLLLSSGNALVALAGTFMYQPIQWEAQPFPCHADPEMLEPQVSRHHELVPFS
jgi:hypothetical protein